MGKTFLMNRVLGSFPSAIVLVFVFVWIFFSLIDLNELDSPLAIPEDTCYITDTLFLELETNEQIIQHGLNYRRYHEIRPR